jgi:hypothetical protein
MGLVQAGRLLRVTPEVPSAEMLSRGDACKMSAYGRPLHPWTCEPNARCLVEAMRADGDDWAVVGGFAIGPVAAYPVRHVWVRNGGLHFDPTWSRRITHFMPPADYRYRMVSITDFRYFALPTSFPDREGLDYLTRQAATLGLELLENHPEASGEP